jgi:16S rRNA (cytosine967-C5)-methyltransferase
MGRAQELLAKLAARKPHDELAALLLAAIAHMLDETPAYAPHVLVDQAVLAARKSAGTQAQAGFVNACLRRLLREREALLAELTPLGQWNHPVWWIKRLRQDHPQHWQAILQASQVPAALVLRINPLRTSRDAYLAALQDAGLAGVAVGEHGVQLAQSHPVPQLPGFREGWFSVQDTAAQLAAPLLLGGLDRAAPLRLLDACAAPGGKTAHLLELAPRARLTALEIAEDRVPRIGDNLARLGLQAEVRCADAAQVPAWWDGELFDGVLLDAPCSASGIVRRHPDVRWLRRASDIDQLVQTQQRLLTQLWPLVKPGGYLLYATCSVFKAEGQGQLKVFQQHHADAQLCASPGHLLPGAAQFAGGAGENQPGEHDGFFYALLHKRPG